IRCHGHVINLASQAFIFAPDKETINAVENKIRQEAESEDKDDPNSTSKKKKGLSWKDARPLRKLHAIIAYMRSSELLYNEFLNAIGRMIPMDNDTR
ncbi:hypothetical protein CC80DRAFT_399572, partial [Byssothecium circinans]